MSAWDKEIEEAEAMKREIELRLERLYECREVYRWAYRYGSWMEKRGEEGNGLRSY